MERGKFTQVCAITNSTSYGGKIGLGIRPGRLQPSIEGKVTFTTKKEDCGKSTCKDSSSYQKPAPAPTTKPTPKPTPPPHGPVRVNNGVYYA